MMATNRIDMSMRVANVGDGVHNGASAYSWSKQSGTSGYYNILNKRREAMRTEDMGADENLLLEWMCLSQELDVLSRIGCASEAAVNSKQQHSVTSSATNFIRKATKKIMTPSHQFKNTIPITDRPRVCIIERREKESIGLQIASTKSSTVPKVSWVNSTGPSYIAGVRAGDVLMQINGMDCIDKSNAEIAKMIQGAGTEVRLLVAATHGKQSLDDSIEHPSSEEPSKARTFQVTDLNSLFATTATAPVPPEVVSQKAEPPTTPDAAAAVRQIAQGMAKKISNNGSTISPSKKSPTNKSPSSTSNLSRRPGQPSKKIYSTVIKGVETFSDASALSRGSQYSDKPAKQKMFWEKEEEPKKSKHKFLRASSRKEEREREKTDKETATSNVERPIKAFINDKRKAGSFGNLDRTFDRPTKTESPTKQEQEQQEHQVSAEVENYARQGKSVTELLVQIQSERDEARDERDQLVEQLVSLTDNYEELLNNKETHIDQLEKTVEKRIKDIKTLEKRTHSYQTKSQTVASSHNTEVYQLTQSQEKLVKEWNKAVTENQGMANENRRLKALLTESTSKLSKMKKELATTTNSQSSDSSELIELREMVVVMEEALEAKDEVLKMKLLTREDELAQLKKQMRVDLALEQDKIRSSLHTDFEALQDELTQMKELHEVEKQYVVNAKQAEMDKAMQELQSSIYRSLDSNDAHAKSESIMFQQMSAALEKKDIEKQDALDVQTNLREEMLAKKDMEMGRALQQKDKELGAALNMAQREVDNLLEQKQIEVDELLNSKDFTIANLHREVEECKSKIQLTMAATSKTISSVESSNALKTLHVLLDTKAAEVQQLESHINTLHMEHTEAIAVLQERNEEVVAEAIKDKQAEMASVMDQMQSALTEAMSAKGDLLCLDEMASDLIAKEFQHMPKQKFNTTETLQRIESSLANTDSGINQEVIKLKLQIARLLNKEVTVVTNTSQSTEETTMHQQISSLEQENLELHHQLTAMKAKLITKKNLFTYNTSTPSSPSRTTDSNNGDTNSQADAVSIDKTMLQDLGHHVSELRPAFESCNSNADLSVYREQHVKELAQMELSVSASEAKLASSTKLLEDLQASNATLETSQTELQQTVHTLESDLQSKIEEVSSLYMSRRRLLNEILELKGNARVFCRIRPLLSHESGMEQAQLKLGAVDVGRIGIVDDSGRNVEGTKTSKNYDFEFNGVFDQSVAQTQVFEEIKQMVDCSISGYNVCMFAYGQTGSGKTYTMTGEADPSKEGIIPRTVKYVFEEIARLAKRGWTFTVSTCFLEIYNETIRDLLVDSDVATRNLPKYDIKQGKDGAMYVTNLTHKVVEDYLQLAHLVDCANENRAVGFSDLNEHSSRSHSICQLTLCGKNSETNTSMTSKLSMVDLAGSERLMRPEQIIDAAPMDDRARLKLEFARRQKETLNINKSLSNLANVVQAIQSKSQHIPYRNSKLTYFLQDALGGDSKSLMMVNVSPREDCLNETLNSLRFAAKVNNTSFGKAVQNVSSNN